MTFMRINWLLVTAVICCLLNFNCLAINADEFTLSSVLRDVLVNADEDQNNEVQPEAGLNGEESTCTEDSCDKDEESCDSSSCEKEPCGNSDEDNELAADNDSTDIDSAENVTATHHQTKIIKVHVGDLPETSLHTFCLTADGEILAACGESESGDVRRFSATGDLIDSWELPYAPEAINTGSDGHVYVAGSGKFSRYTIEGELVGEGKHPFGDPTEEMLDKARKDVIASHKQQLTWMTQQLEELESSVEKFEAKVKAEKEAAEQTETDSDPIAEENAEESDQQEEEESQADEEAAQEEVAIYDDLTDDPDIQVFESGDNTFLLVGGTGFMVPEPTEDKTEYEAILEQLISQRDSYQQMVENQGDEELTEEQIEEKIKQSLLYKMKVASISEADGEVFLATGAQQGYGFSVWRTNRHFDSAELIVKQLSGCCGQMDVQACCDGIFVAENSRHKVRRFDRTGDEVCSWGSGNREGLRGFGGCCNPMNVAFGPDQTVYTAESETGRIKRFTNEGELIELVGKADLVPGCKKVSIAVGPNGDRVYMLDITRNHIVMLERPADGEVVAYSEENNPRSGLVATFSNQGTAEIEVDSFEGFFRSLGRAMAKNN